MSFFVGVAHPWVRCGHDFGASPHPWRGRAATDWRDVEAELRRWREEAGVTWSRWWVLAGGVNYPVGSGPRARLEQRGRSTAPRPAPLPRAFLDDFERLLRAASRAGVRLMPSLLSFEFFFPRTRRGPRGPFSGGHGPLVFGNGGAPVEAAVDAFLDATLEPLLDVSRRHREAIGAWEVINEPDWVVGGGPLHLRVVDGRPRRTPKSVAPAAMGALIARGVDRVVRAGFVASVGFKRADPSWLSARVRRRLQRHGDAGDYLHQLHHYPSLLEPWPLPRHDRLPIRPCLVGEMPTARGRLADPFVTPWLDDGDWRRALEVDRYLERRLEIVRRKGYPGALLWSARARDRATAWGPAQWRQVRRFLHATS